MKTAYQICMVMFTIVTGIISLVFGFVFPSIVDLGIAGTVLFPMMMTLSSFACFFAANTFIKKII